MMGLFEISDISCPRENVVRLGMKDDLFIEAQRDSRHWHIAYPGEDVREALFREKFPRSWTRDEIICVMVGMRIALLANA
jgi:hypothetical protein